MTNWWIIRLIQIETDLVLRQFAKQRTETKIRLSDLFSDSKFLRSKNTNLTIF